MSANGYVADAPGLNQYSKNSKAGRKDSYYQAIYDMWLMEQQYNYDDAWWNEHDSPEAQYSQLRALGYSDAFINQYLLSGSGDSTSLPADSVNASDSQGTAAQMNAAANAAGNVTDSMQADAQRQVQASEVAKNESEANLNNVNAGLRPDESGATVRNLDSGSALNESNVQRNDVLNRLTDAEVGHIASQIGVEEKQAQFYESQAYYYNGITDATIREMDAHAAAYYSEVRLNNQKVKESESVIDLNQALTDEAMLRGDKVLAETQGQYLQNHGTDLSNQVAEANVKSLRDRGVLLTMDLENKVSELEAAGKYDEAEKMVRGQFKYMLARSQANSEGAISLPADYDLKKSDGYNSKRTPYGWIGGATRALNVGFNFLPGIPYSNAMRGAYGGSTPRTNVNPSRNSSGSSYKGLFKDKNGQLFEGYQRPDGSMFYWKHYPDN